jgi:TonB-like protein
LPVLPIASATDSDTRMRSDPKGRPGQAIRCQAGRSRKQTLVNILKVMASVVALSAVVSAQQPSYTPPRLVRGDLPGLPPATVVGGGEVLIEATVDQNGALTHPIVLRSTPPFSNIVLDAVSRWRFAPARATTPDGKETAVDSTVLIAAIYRPPTLMNGPTLGDRPRDLADASSSSPYPVSTVAPSYPPQARSGSVVLYELSLDENGQMKNMRGIGSDSGFDAAAKDALIQWKFRGASVRGRPVPSLAYVIFGFSEPVVSPGPGSSSPPSAK